VHWQQRRGNLRHRSQSATTAHMWLLYISNDNLVITWRIDSCWFLRQQDNSKSTVTTPHVVETEATCIVSFLYSVRSTFFLESCTATR